MSTKSWRKNTSIIDKVVQAPYDFQFLQAVRLLERASVYQKKLASHKVAINPVASFAQPSSESLRFKTNHSLAFNSSEVGPIKLKDVNQQSQWEMVVNIMGLTGSMGVLPFHYSEMVLQRQKEKDRTQDKFYDLFNHRTLSLFYQASTKYKLPISYERNRLFHSKKTSKEPQTKVLLSLIGLGTNGLQNRLHINDESLLYYSGLFTQKVSNVTSLKQILHRHFNIPIGIKQFIGQWQDLIDDVRTKLPDFNNPTGCNVRLGKSAMLGKRSWFAQGKIHIILGPLNKQQLEAFAPGTTGLKAVNELVRMYVGMEIDYDIIIRIKKSDIPSRMCLGTKDAAVIGWNSWLSSKLIDTKDRNKTVDLSISSKRLG